MSEPYFSQSLPARPGINAIFQHSTTDELEQMLANELAKWRAWLTSEGMDLDLLPIPTKSYRDLVVEEAARLAREEEDEA